MNAILQDSSLLGSSSIPVERRRSRRDAHVWAVLTVAALEWAGLAVAVLAFAAAGIAVWLG